MASTTYYVGNAQITGVKREEALNDVLGMADARSGGYICFVNAHVSVMTKQYSPVNSAINHSTFSYPDGAPVYFVGKYLQGMNIDKISGPDFLDMMFSSERGRKLRHFFYGGSTDVVDRLIKSLTRRYPGCNIVGGISPPFRELTLAEREKDLAAIRDSEAQIVWIGLGAPKQELWMHQNTSQLPNALLMGVGAAFDFHSGSLNRAPYWMQKCGLEWLYRLNQEPRRLWKRYLTTNLLFVLYQLLALTKSTSSAGPSVSVNQELSSSARRC